MNVVDAAGKAEMSMSEVAGGVDDVLGDLLRHQEILGALAVSVEGLIIGCAGIDESDAELAGALAAALVGATERTVRRLGAGNASAVSVATSDGMIHLRSGGDFALIVFSEPADGTAVGQICQGAISRIEQLLQPVA
jgi:predicted regulator of Ras-like GTPase activity (Roadblock/LC7/MglB family)